MDQAVREASAATTDEVDRELKRIANRIRARKAESRAPGQPPYYTGEQRALTMERVDSHAVSADPASVRPEQPSASPSAVVALLDQWMTEDEVEQRETFEILRRALDERRPANCKLFP